MKDRTLMDRTSGTGSGGWPELARWVSPPPSFDGPDAQMTARLSIAAEVASLAPHPRRRWSTV